MTEAEINALKEEKKGKKAKTRKNNKTKIEIPDEITDDLERQRYYQREYKKFNIQIKPKL